MLLDEDVARFHNLPARTTPLIGREREVEAINRRLLSPDVRLVTLTGPGGIGKTRAALAVAGRVVDRFPDGVFSVSVAPLEVRVPLSFH